ncbi:hypothetical protein AB0B89_02200 [Sphaerisporangium sp. NPDC049002]|uniref:hypothetical protein n=1 Tax=unclassified Sphaerisporangium TaxID=2630420 RepID=UPI0033DCA7F2
MDHSNHTLLQAGSQTAISDRMRELLARAAQDHVYEQRTQGAVLDEIRQRLEGMEWLLREVRERELGGLSGALETVGGQLGELATRPPAWAEGLAQHVEVVRDRVDGVGDRVAVIVDRIDSVSERVRPVAELPGLLNDLGTVREGVAESLKRLQALLDGGHGVPERMAELSGRLGRLTAGMEAAGGRFTRVDKALLDLTQRTERLEGGVLDLSEALEETLASAIERLTGSVDQLAGKVDGMTAQLADAETRLSDRLDGAGGLLAGFDGRLEGVEGHLAGFAARFDCVEGHLGELRGRADSVDGRFDSVDSHIGAVEGRLETVDVRLQSIDGRVETADSRLAGVDGRLAGLDQRLTDVGDRLTAQDQRFTTLGESFEGVNERLEMVDDRVEAVNQRVGQLPGLLEVGEVHKRVGELLSAQGDDQGKRLDAIDKRLTEAATALPPMAELMDLMRARPDRAQLAETVDEVIQPTHNDLTRRLGALEETMLALAEALLRPTRTPKD